MKKLTRDEIEAKRAQFSCDDYKPLPNDYKCQHYIKGGSCERDDYFMCVEWIKANPDKARAAERDARAAARPPAPVIPLSAQTERQAPREKHLRMIQGDDTDSSLGTSKLPRARPGEAKGDVYDLKTLLRKPEDGSDKPLLAHPELLTEEAIGALEKQGIEVTVKTANGTEVTLVPAFTKSKRAELTWAHARSIVMVLQVFPGATIESISKPPKEDVG